jgi:6-phosphofructokinase 1
VISGAGIEALDRGYEVVGLYDGFESVCHGKPIDLKDPTGPARMLQYEDLTHIHWEGGSILRTSRKKPSDKDLPQILAHLKALDVKYLLTIGGDDTLTSSRRLNETSQGALGVAHVPKTIDNDLPLEANTPTFGFETARHRGTEIALSMLYDAKATRRWYFVVMMGRSAGHLALGVAKAAGATTAIIPEEFKKGEKITIDDIADTIIGSMLVRRAGPRPRLDGMAVIAEGVATRLSDDELNKLKERHLADIGRDSHGNLKLSDIQLGRALQLTVKERLGKGYTLNGGPPLTDGIVIKDVGYELRCCHPIPFDVEYTRNLGYAAAKLLLSGQSGYLVSLRDGRTNPIRYEDVPTDTEGKVQPRTVDVTSESYEVARRYMFRLEREHLENPSDLARLTQIAGNMTPEQFKARFERAVNLQAYTGPRRRSE